MTDLIPVNHFSAAIAISEKLNDIGPRLIDAERFEWREQAKVIEEAESLQGAISGASDAIAEAQRPATTKEIAINLGMLLKAFPYGGRDDVRAFGDMLVADVRDQRPSIAALVMGCAKLRKTSEFFPTIAKVMGAIEEVDSRLRASKTRLGILPERLEYLKSLAAEGERVERIRWDREGKEPA